MREQNDLCLLRRAGVVLGHPAQFGDSERGHWHRADSIGPGLSAELIDEIGCGRGRSGVVPQQRRADDVTLGVEEHHAVLLRPDRDRTDVVEAARVEATAP